MARYAKVVPLVVLSLTPLLAQTEGPVKLIDIHRPDNKAPVEVTVANDSTKKIEALVFRTTFLDDHGKISFINTVTVAFSPVLPKATTPPIMPGERRAIKLGSEVPPGTTDRRVELDYVRFQDGTHWGPDRAKKSQYIEGLRIGARSR